MTIANMSDDQGSRILLLGLSAENVERLKKGEIVHITRTHPGAKCLPAGWQIVICYGEPAELQKQMKVFMNKDTKILDKTDKPSPTDN